MVGNSAEVLLTPFDAYAMPLIRDAPGDYITLSSSPSSVMPALRRIERIAGRERIFSAIRKALSSILSSPPNSLRTFLTTANGSWSNCHRKKLSSGLSVRRLQRRNKSAGWNRN